MWTQSPTYKIDLRVMKPYSLRSGQRRGPIRSPLQSFQRLSAFLKGTAYGRGGGGPSPRPAVPWYPPHFPPQHLAEFSLSSRVSVFVAQVFFTLFLPSQHAATVSTQPLPSLIKNFFWKPPIYMNPCLKVDKESPKTKTNVKHVAWTAQHPPQRN